MYSRKEQYEIISKVSVRDDDTKRINCPFCGGKYTLTISKRDGSLIWNCYKASCSASGGKRVGYGLDALKRKFNNNEPSSIHKRIYPLPEVNSSIEHHEHVIKYIDDNNCRKAFDDGAIKITYDPAKDRVLFWMNSDEGAVGRTLTTGVKPKWLSYGDTQGVLSVGNKDTVIIVEDAASACAVYATGVYTGLALLGTNVSSLQRIQLNQYKKLIICLDKDASKKAIRISRSLSGTVNTTVCFIREDFKYLSPYKILEEIDEGTGASGHRL
jgi:ribosomal protein L37AE/L43A/5S rRNA maturation endonuclease (ribonuclease M5)